MNPNKALTSKDPILKDASSDLTRVQFGQVTIQVLWVCSLLSTKRSTLGRVLQVNPKAQFALVSYIAWTVLFNPVFLVLKLGLSENCNAESTGVSSCSVPIFFAILESEKKKIETHYLVLYSSVSSVYHRKMVIVTICNNHQLTIIVCIYIYIYIFSGSQISLSNL